MTETLVHNAGASTTPPADATSSDSPSTVGVGTSQPVDAINQVFAMSQDMAIRMEGLAAHFDRTGKPYAHRKAATIRKECGKLTALTDKLALS
ncbi:hypothetical protein LTR53_020321, partial [Teratosphaeriaceae sp. CCFEE 6253]